MAQFPDFPLEIWLQIFDHACNDDGTTGMSLSVASRLLRHVSRYHRYRSVMIVGWKRLLDFEEEYSKVPRELRNTVNLFVDLPELYSVAYPEESWFPYLSSDEDSSYIPSDEIPSDDEGDTEEEEEDGEKALDKGKENALDMGKVKAEISDEDDSEDDASSVSSKDSEWYDEESNVEYSADSDWEPDLTDIIVEEIHGQDLSCLQDANNTLRQLEFKVYSALRRVLEASSHSLDILTLCWRPSSSFHLEAVFPILPRLRSLAIFKDEVRQEATASVMYKFHLKRVYPVPVLFPALEKLNVNGNGLTPRAWDEHAFKGLLNTPLKLISAPKAMIKHLTPLPETVQEVRVYMDTECRGCNSLAFTQGEITGFYGKNVQYRSPTAVYRCAASEKTFDGPLDYKRDWLEQVGPENAISSDEV